MFGKFTEDFLHDKQFFVLMYRQPKRSNNKLTVFLIRATMFIYIYKIEYNNHEVLNELTLGSSHFDNIQNSTFSK